MSTHAFLESQLLNEYAKIRESTTPDWAVRKRKNNDNNVVIPTIPFVGKHYLEQPKKILVYASAENLTEYWEGNRKDPWPNAWLDCNAQAENRHRRCFDNPSMQKNLNLPYVHCGPLEDGGLLVAAMYLASKIRNEVQQPRDFYETIAFGNYGKYSIETVFQKAVRENPTLSDNEKKELQKHLAKSNIDYATNSDFLAASSDFIRKDIEILKPDYIIMPNMNDNNFINAIANHAKIVKINQIIPVVIHNMGENGRNNPHNKYKARDINTLPCEIQNVYHNIRRINHEKYRFVFDHLDEALANSLR